MKLTTEEAINDLVETKTYLKNTGVLDHPANKKCGPSIDKAIDALQKNQKIKSILDNRFGKPVQRVLNAIIEEMEQDI